MSQPGGKMARFSAATKATENVSAMVDGKSNDSGTVIDIPVANVLPDPKNHRRVKLDWDNPEEISDTDPQAEAKRAELESLREMAGTIGTSGLGLINAITVVRRGDKYQLIAGHRRTLAHKLLGLSVIKANVRSKILTRLAQHVENAQRLNQDLPELLISLRGVLEEIGVPVVEGIDHKSIQQALENDVHYGRSQAYRLAVILVAPEALSTAIELGHVTSIKEAAELARLPEDELALELQGRADREAYFAPQTTGQSDDAGGNGTKAPHRSGPTQRRAKDYVTLGKVRNPSVIKIVMEKVLGNDVPSDINWSDLKSVERAFKKMLENLAEQAK